MSLIEVVIILVIIAVLTTFALVQVGQSNTQLERQNIARKLKVLLERARFDSVKRRVEDLDEMSHIVINNETSFSAMMDFNQNGELDIAEIQQVNFGGIGNIKIVGNNLLYPITISFDRRGRVTATDKNGASITPRFIVCNNCTPATADNANANIISISSTGTINMISGGDVLPTFLSPNVSTVNSSSGINDWVTVSDDTSAFPINTPTPSLTPTPSVTPTPKACVKNEKTSQTNCICKLPMTVRSSGACR